MNRRTRAPKTPTPYWDRDVVRRTIGTRVLEARGDLGLTQRQLAERVGLDFTAIAHIEAGRRMPSAEKLVRLAFFLDLTLDFLCGAVDE